jgi:hypothetical protein
MNVLKGINVSPRVVGYARAVLLAAIVAIIEALIKILTGESFGGEWAAYAPIAVLLLRAIEGEIDQKQTPAQNVTPAPGDVVKVAIGDTPIATVPIAPPVMPTDPPTTPPTAPAA